METEIRFVEHEDHVDIEERILGIWAVTRCSLPGKSAPSITPRFKTPINLKKKRINAVENKTKTPRKHLTSKDFRQKNKLKYYGLNEEEYETMRNNQDDKCAICGNKQKPHINDGDLYIDHDHKSGKVRGLLCNYCNTGLGHLRTTK